MAPSLLAGVFFWGEDSEASSVLAFFGDVTFEFLVLELLRKRIIVDVLLWLRKGWVLGACVRKDAETKDTHEHEQNDQSNIDRIFKDVHDYTSHGWKEPKPFIPPDRYSV